MNVMSVKLRSYYQGIYDVAKDLNCHALLKDVPMFVPCDRFHRDPEAYQEGRATASEKYNLRISKEARG